MLRHKLNRGYGGALKSGVAASRTRYTITVDADGQHRPEDVRRLYAAIRSADADMVIGSRRGQQDASALRALGKALIRALAKALMRVPVHDLNSGMKIVDTALAQQVLHLCPDTMAYSDTIALLFINRRGLVLEEPIQVRARQGRPSTIGLRDAIGTVRAIINMAAAVPSAERLPARARPWPPRSGLTLRCYLINSVSPRLVSSSRRSSVASGAAGRATRRPAADPGTARRGAAAWLPALRRLLRRRARSAQGRRY